MGVKNTLEKWVTTNDQRLVKKQTSIRLPVHVAAKIQALCDMYPTKSKTEIITDLLAASLDEAYEAFPYCPGESVQINGETHYKDAGPRKRYTELANQHFVELESELGNQFPSTLFKEPSAWHECAVDEICNNQ